MSLQESDPAMSIPADLSIPTFLDRTKAKPLVYTYTILNTFKELPASRCSGATSRRIQARLSKPTQ